MACLVSLKPGRTIQNSQKFLISALLVFSGLQLSACSGANPQLADIAGGIFGSEVGAIFRAGQALNTATSPLSAEEEYYLGRAVSASILGRWAPVRDEALQNYVNRVGLVVAAASDVPETFGGYHFAVLDTSEVNALAAPGGFIFVSSGFVKMMRSEDELAAVLAHEVGHVARKHGLAAISQAKMSEALLVLGKEVASSQVGGNLALVTDAFGDVVSDVVDTIITNGYSRSQEYEADKYAYQLLGSSGYKQEAFTTVLALLSEHAAIAEESGWFSTHPEPKDRLARLGAESAAVRPVTQMSADESVRRQRFIAATKKIS